MIGTLIGIAGLILTLIFGIYTIWIAKKSKRKVSLGLEKKECYSLFKKEISRLNIDIKYGGDTIDNYLILFKGTLLNNGQTDIDKSRVYKPLQIKTKTEYEWLETNLYESPEGATVNLKKINKNTIELSWDLLKKQEKIEFESLIEIPQSIEIEDISDDFYDSLVFDFRITDVNEIQKLSEVNQKEKKKNRAKRKLLGMSVFTFLAGLYITFSPELPEKFSLFKTSKEIEFELIYKTGIVYSSLKPINTEKIEVNIDNLKEEKSVKEFNNEFRINRIKSLKITEGSILSNRLMGGSYLILSILTILLYFKKKTTTNTV